MIQVAWGTPSDVAPTQVSVYRPSMYQILVEVAGKHGLTLAEIKSNRRERRISWPRHEAMWRASKETTLSLKQMARELNGCDHTSVIYGIRAHEKRRNISL